MHWAEALCVGRAVIKGHRRGISPGYYEHDPWLLVCRRSLERQSLCSLVNPWWNCNVLCGCVGQCASGSFYYARRKWSWTRAEWSCFCSPLLFSFLVMFHICFLDSLLHCPSPAVMITNSNFPVVGINFTMPPWTAKWGACLSWLLSSTVHTELPREYVCPLSQKVSKENRRKIDPNKFPMCFLTCQLENLMTALHIGTLDFARSDPLGSMQYFSYSSIL